MKSKITAVIVNWNRKNDVIRLLDTVSRLNYPLTKVVVVDNASTDDSVSAIRCHPLDVILIENPINLGGTGGFNSGIRYALDNLEQDYIWLIDNDATVDPNALSALVYVMEQDTSIAVAGSKILNAHDPNYIVETGAYLDWRTASVQPVNRNVLNSENLPSVIDVEYVAICSALLRISAINIIGLMDERYFLLWDDMDWGISFKMAGFRVVAVNNSIIYHPPFTEKRSLAVDNYYGIRNSLLTVSKRSKGIPRCWAVLTICRRASRIFCLAGLDAQTYAKHLILQAMVDFLFNRWGKLSFRASQVTQNTGYVASILPWSSIQTGRVLILNSGSSSEINDVIKSLEANCGNSVVIDVVIQSDRKDLINIDESGNLVEVNFEASNALYRNFIVFCQLRKKKYMVAINPSSDRTSPFAYVTSMLARFDSATGSLICQKSHPFWKVCLVTMCSELAALASFPFVLIRAYIYGRSR